MASRRRARKVSARRSALPAAAPNRPTVRSMLAWCIAFEKAANELAVGMAALVERASAVAEANEAREAGRLH